MATDDASKLFVAGLPDSITEDVLREIFHATGVTVVNVSLPKDRLTGRARGFGFVTLGSPDEAEKARSSLDGSDQSGRSISVRPFSAGPQKRSAEPKPDNAGSDRTLYVGNLPFDMSQKDVEQLFQDNKIGSVVRVHLPAGPDGRPRGFGFVTLASAEAANEAISALANVDVKGRKLQVNLAHARGERRDRDRGAPERVSARPVTSRRPDDGFAPSRPPESVGGSGPQPPFEPRAPEGRRAKEKPEAKRRKRDKGKRRTERDEFHKRERGGGSTWAKWNKDWDDD